MFGTHQHRDGQTLISCFGFRKLLGECELHPPQRKMP